MGDGSLSAVGLGVELADLEVLVVETVESTEDTSKRAEDSSSEGVLSRGGDGIRSGEAAGVGLEAVTLGAGVCLGSGVRKDVILEVFLVVLMDSGVPEALGVLLGRWLGEPLEDRSFLKFVMWASSSEPGGRPGNS